MTLRDGASTGSAPPQDERADVLAWLDRRIRNHAKVASRLNGSDERAALLRRECEIIRDTFHAGLHEGQAEVERRMGGAAG